MHENMLNHFQLDFHNYYMNLSVERMRIEYLRFIMKADYD